jgi:glycosyltransferase involved in cell wall biosynthesis
MIRNPKPLVSVVMAVKDAQRNYFLQALRSILEQTLSDYEFIVVEDPGRRSVAAILAETEDPRIRYYANATQTSLVKQRNRGLAEARAPLVAVMDADDVAEPQRLQKQYDYFQAHPEVDVLGSHIRAIDESDRLWGYRRYPEDHADILRALPRFPPFCQPSVMYRRDTVLDAGGYRQTRYPVEDYELWSRLAIRGARMANLPDALLRYRFHPRQMKQARMCDILRGVLEVKEMYWQDRMTRPDRFRCWLERGLLLMPRRLVLALFITTHYRTQSLSREGLHAHLPRWPGGGAASFPSTPVVGEEVSMPHLDCPLVSGRFDPEG